MIFKRSFLPALFLIGSLFLVGARTLQETPPTDILVIVQLAAAAFAALVGWPALLSVIVVALQYFGKLSTSAGETFLFWANVVGFLAVFVLALLGKIDLINQVDATFGTLAKLLTYLLILMGAPIAFERAHATTERFRMTRAFQARVIDRAR